MIKENENEKSLRFIKSIAIIIIYTIVGLFALFFFAVVKVNAYTTAKSNIWVNGQRCITNDWDGLGTISCLNNSVTWYNARTDLNLSMTSGKKYTMFYRSTIKVPFSNTGYSSNLNVVVSYKRGSTLGDMTSCTTTQSHTITYNSTNPSAEKLVTHEIAVACQGVSFSSATDGIVVRAQVDNSGSLKSAMQVKLSQLYLEQDTADNTDITNAIDNAMQSIINNQNNNSQTINNNINNNTNAINNNTEAVEDLNDTMTSEDLPSISNIQVTTIDDTPISGLLLLPLNLMNVIINGDSGSCVDYSFGTLYGHNLKLKCINFENILGSNLYHVIDILMVFFIIYELGKLIVSTFNDITSLRDGFDSLYEPQHAEYKPKHGAGYERVGD